MSFEAARHCLCDLTLGVEQVVQFVLEIVVRPDLKTVLRVDQMNAQAKARANLANSAFDGGLDIQLARDLRRVLRRMFITHCY